VPPSGRDARQEEGFIDLLGGHPSSDLGLGVRFGLNLEPPFESGLGGARVGFRLDADLRGMP
jgi:hypothetical protein